MKVLKKIMATTIAIFISVTFAFGPMVKVSPQEINLAYATSDVDGYEQQRQELQKALDDAANVRSTNSYKNASKKDVNLYEESIKAGQRLLNNTSATGQQLYDATKNIDINRRYLPISANIILINQSIENLETKLLGINYIEKKMPNSFKKYKKVIQQAKQNSLRAIQNAKVYIEKNQR